MIFLRRALSFVAELLFPLTCIGCKREGFWVCDSCENLLVVKPILSGPDSFLSQQIALAPYTEGKLLARLIHAFKYQGACVEPVLERFLAQFFTQHKIDDIDVVVSVPLHYRREAERGMNQATVIAQLVSRHLDVPVVSLLKRTRATKQQARLHKDHRTKNVASAFRVRQSFLYQKILLVDDVFTTGSTMHECARVLREAGAHEVIGFTLAKVL